MENAREAIKALLGSECREAGPWVLALQGVAKEDALLSSQLFECFWRAEAPSVHWSMACWLALCDPRFAHKGPLATSVALAGSGLLAWRSNLVWVPKTFEEREWMEGGMSGLFESLGPPRSLGMGVGAVELRDALVSAARSGAWEGTEMQAHGWVSLHGWQAWSRAVGRSLERVELGEAACSTKKSEGPSRSL